MCRWNFISKLIAYISKISVEFISNSSHLSNFKIIDNKFRRDEGLCLSEIIRLIPDHVFLLLFL